MEAETTHSRDFRPFDRSAAPAKLIRPPTGIRRDFAAGGEANEAAGNKLAPFEAGNFVFL
jgi:hypothetical protein